MNSVWVIVLNWNNAKVTNQCLASLQALKYDNFHILVVDNGSTDGSVTYIRARFPEVEIIELDRNLGFATGNNAGIRSALEGGAEFIWLLNNDTSVHPLALHAMVEKAQSDPRIGAVGSAIYDMADPKRLMVWGGGEVNFWLGRSRHFPGPVLDDRLQFLTGASMLLRRTVLQTIGLLDGEYFLYWEDVDYCVRMRRAGWRLAVAETSTVWHASGSTSRKNTANLDLNLSRSTVRFFRRNAPLPIVPLAVSTGLRLAKRAAARDWERCRAVWGGATTG